MKEFYIEIYSEEIPARMQPAAQEQMKDRLGALLQQHFPTYDLKHVESFITPLRLIAVARNLPESTEGSTEELRGPKLGAPDQALQGFLSKFGYVKDQLYEREGYWYAKKETTAMSTAELLPHVVRELLGTFTWPKSMRWASARQTWVRPIRRVITVWEGQPLTFPLPSLGFETNQGSDHHVLVTGHRFMAPQAFEVTTFDDYRRKLKVACVIIDPKERTQIILEDLKEIAEKKGYTLKEDEKLLSEVTGLVEFPMPMIGQIPEQYMRLPDPVLETTMRVHQKYFTLLTPRLNSAPAFGVVANRQGKDGGRQMIRGYETVVNARLRDASFFFDNDVQKPLEEMAERLDTIVFQEQLGTVSEKVARLMALMGEGRAKRAAQLCKADLLSEMVFEFPELQGIMGRTYALAQNEEVEVADAIKEHYQPLGPTDVCPSKDLSVRLALADKLDTLYGFFAINMIPTGSKDPFALRRAALGIIRLIRENNLHTFDLKEFLGKVARLYQEKLPSVNEGEVIQRIIAFIIERMKVAMRSEGIRHDCIDAVVDGKDAKMWMIARRASALHHFLGQPQGQALLKGYRRAVHIVEVEEKKTKESFNGSALDKALLTEGPEKELSQHIRDLEASLGQELETHNYETVMNHLAHLQKPIDRFFEEITVNVSDSAVRLNRLNILAGIRTLMNKVADFSKVEG